MGTYTEGSPELGDVDVGHRLARLHLQGVALIRRAGGQQPQLNSAVCVGCPPKADLLTQYEGPAADIQSHVMHAHRRALSRLLTRCIGITHQHVCKQQLQLSIIRRLCCLHRASGHSPNHASD